MALHAAVDGGRAGAATDNDHRADLVVLPFQPLMDDSEISFLQQGVPEVLTTELSTNSALRVLSNREALRFDDTTEVVTIGRELGVARVLTGTFLRAENIVRVTTQLVSAQDGTVQWSHTSEHELSDALTLQDQICSEILQKLPNLRALEMES